MKNIFTIMMKEIGDNLRDRRSLFFAIIYGPIMMPAMMFGPMIFNANKHIQDYETPSEIHVVGEKIAPTLINHLKEKNIKIKTAPDNYKQQLIEGEIDIVLEISNTYGEKFVKGTPARVTIHYDKDRTDSQKVFWTLRGELVAYARTISAYRMVSRGLDQQLLRSIDIVENDISREDSGAGMIANMTMFLVIFSMMMGGFYLAVDITAGERERLSLEPLLSLAISRFEIALGKYLSILTFVFLSFLLPLISITILVSFIPEDFYGNSAVPTFLTFVKLAVLTFPLCFFMAGFLMALSTATKSTKEAQTQVGFAMFIPMLPFFLMMAMNIKLTALTGSIPILGQYLMAGKIVMNPDFSLLTILPNALTTLALAAALISVAVYLYRKESILV